MKKAIIILALLLIPTGAKAQFGFEQDLILLKQLAMEVLIQQSTLGTQSNTGSIDANTLKCLQLATQLAQTINTVRYQGLRGLLWQAPYLLQGDRYGLAGPWMRAASGQMPARPAYQIATVPVPLGDYPAYYSSATPAQQQRIAVDYALLQDTDAENAAALAAIGDSNQAMPSGQMAVTNLAQDNFAMGFAATNPQLSQVALMQKQDISSTMGVQVNMQNQQLLAHILHELILMNTRARNEEAKKLNADSLIHVQTVNSMQDSSGLSGALSSMRY